MRNDRVFTYDKKFMLEAINCALIAKKKDEVPIGAVIVKGDKIIAKAYNLMEKKQDPTCHAEIIAIKKACKKLKSWRLDDCVLYVTVEPCSMCAGAIANARIPYVFFGAYEEKSGGAISKFPILTDSGLNHRCEFEGGFELETCSKLLKNYFKGKRKPKSLD